MIDPLFYFPMTKELCNDIKNLLSIIVEGKEGYQSAAAATDIPELKSLLIKLSDERRAFAFELKAYIAHCGEDIIHGNGGLVGGGERARLSNKIAEIGVTNTWILATIIKGENAVIDRYNESITAFNDQVDYINLLISQRNELQETLEEIEFTRIWYQGYLIK